MAQFGTNCYCLPKYMLYNGNIQKYQEKIPGTFYFERKEGKSSWQKVNMKNG